MAVRSSTADDRMARLLEQAKSGKQRSLARLCSVIERGDASNFVASLDIIGLNWNADVISITGAPGCGKSTLVARLMNFYRLDGLRVGILAIDPSSSLTGGALLGDRVRVDPSNIDDNVFFRSIADHGHRGGISAATGAEIALLDACGFDVVIVETVGTGQSDIDIRSFVETVVVVCAPGGGDEIQTLKAGILEIGDVFVVNKSDLDGSTRVANDLREMVTLGTYDANGWQPPIVSVSVLEEASVLALKAELGRRRTWLNSNVSRLERARRRAQSQVIDAAINFVRARSFDGNGAQRASELGECVVEGKDEIDHAARMLIASLIDERASDPKGPD